MKLFAATIINERADHRFDEDPEKRHKKTGLALGPKLLSQICQ